MKVLFLLLDTIRRDFLTCYGNCGVRTPNLDRLAKRGVVFDNHWVGSMPCMPARRDLLTGRQSFLHRGWGSIEPFDDLLPVELRKKGIYSHLITDHPHYFELGGENYHTAYDTWDFHRGQEFDPWVSLVDAPAVPQHLGCLDPQNWKNRLRQRKEEDYSGPRTVSAAINWLHDNRDADNWFLQVELFDPHEPFICPPRYLDSYGDVWDGLHFDWPHYDRATESPEAVAHIRKAYAGLLTMTDTWVGRLLNTLESVGHFEETLIIFTTDHGTLLGEQGFWMKNFMPVYNEIAHIPMIVKLPGGERAGTRSNAFTQTMDLMPTFLDAFDVEVPPHVLGRSILPAARGLGPARTHGIFGYFGKAVNVTDGQHVYMRNPVAHDNGPLFAYTSMPVAGLNMWFPRDTHARIETGRYFRFARDLPSFRIPIDRIEGIAGTRADDGTMLHPLYDILNDPQQGKPQPGARLEEHFVRLLIEQLEQHEAPPEQYRRLGLPHRSYGRTVAPSTHFVMTSTSLA